MAYRNAETIRLRINTNNPSPIVVRTQVEGSGVFTRCIIVSVEPDGIPPPMMIGVGPESANVPAWIVGAASGPLYNWLAVSIVMAPLDVGMLNPPAFAVLYQMTSAAVRVGTGVSSNEKEKSVIAASK
jgi:hypothetical protein